MEEVHSRMKVGGHELKHAVSDWECVRKHFFICDSGCTVGLGRLLS